jgi:hypothetical protein
MGESLASTSTAAPAKKSRIGLVVFGSIAVGFVLGLLLTLVVFAGGEESEITGSALVAPGAGCVLLAVASSRFTDQPQRWALAPGFVELNRTLTTASRERARGSPRTGFVHGWRKRCGPAGALSRKATN